LRPRIVHERHYIPKDTSISQYLSAQPQQDYGADVAVVIRDFYFVERTKQTTEGLENQNPPKGSTENNPLKDVVKRLDGEEPPSGKKNGLAVPDPSQADKPVDGPKSSTQTREREPSESPSQYGPKEAPKKTEVPGTPDPNKNKAENLEALATRWESVSGSVVSSRGGTALAELRLDFVNIEGRHNDSNVKTDSKGRFDVKLEVGKWQAFVQFDDGTRRPLGVVEVKPNSNEPVTFKF
jgi:hypothetical protein